ncbi:GGDEF domain-containing protein [Brevibacillus brevis]|uniref:GGDEF domain-containing protein n=1 Tax=Brevibacillus brevis TaxID=1393 RepID=A0ABY9SXM5_BREBE|nr:GGDEF domain-containing protein [Brevibacillus brevis]WNC12564.1 GGDEF domain-containing protein [Brevibacillus brevis]
MKLSEIMTTAICTISSDKSVQHAAEKMNEYSTDTLVVVDHGVLTGILLSRHVRAAHPNRIVADAMADPPPPMSPEQNVWEAHDFFENNDTDLVLVMDQERLIGVVTREAVQIKLAEWLDPLTGLYRAPFILCVGEKLLKEQRPFHLFFIDVNEFGKINKKYGHPFGDDVIRTFSAVLSSMVLDKDDYLCRYAGDEFILITSASEERVEQQLGLIEQPMDICDIQVSAAIGHIDGFREPGFCSTPLREHIARASLLSTAAKTKKISPAAAI